MKGKFTLINLFALTGNFLIPVYALSLYLGSHRTLCDLLFFLFVSAGIIERAWETFKTTREKKREEFHGDWTLAAVTATYIVLFFFFVTEFYLGEVKQNGFVTTLGAVLLGASFRLRFWGMAALGKQWAIHAVGAQKIRNVRIIKLGPYKYVRHPIYLGIILEELAYPMIANAFISLLFALIVCIPLVVIRAYCEEQTSIRRFGADYLRYKHNVGMFLPHFKLNPRV